MAYTWNWTIDVIGLAGFLWLGLTAVALVLPGLVRAVGLRLGALLGVLALFVQQPVSGAAFSAAMAPDVVAWAEPVAPLRYLVEGVRNLLIGGSTTPTMALALGAIGVAGLGLVLLGHGRLALVERLASAPSVRPSA